MVSIFNLLSFDYKSGGRRWEKEGKKKRLIVQRW